MQLVTVRFTTKKLSSVFENDVKICELVELIPHVIAGIPPSTAQSYRRFGNWSVEPYVSEPDRRLDRRDRIDRKTAVALGGRRAGKSVAAKVAAAAASGDYSAALNALGGDNG